MVGLKTKSCRCNDMRSDGGNRLCEWCVEEYNSMGSRGKRKDNGGEEI